MKMRVMSEGDGLRIFSEMKHDGIISKDCEPTFNAIVKSHIDENGVIVTDEIETELVIEGAK